MHRTILFFVCLIFSSVGFCEDFRCSIKAKWTSIYNSTFFEQETFYFDFNSEKSFSRNVQFDKKNIALRRQNISIGILEVNGEYSIGFARQRKTWIAPAVWNSFKKYPKEFYQCLEFDADNGAVIFELQCKKIDIMETE